MAKINFDIKYREKIESGEYKVFAHEHEEQEARIVCWDNKGEYPIVALVDDEPEKYDKFGRVPGGNRDGEFSLFLVTPEEELTEFEDGLRQVCEEAVKEAAVFPARTSENFAKTHSAELLALARKELFANDAVLKEYANVAREQGKAESLRTRATELTKNLANSGMDKDSVPYHLIEFMCNLYTCQNWKEIEETAEAYVTRIKAAAMKDLPRWKKDKSFETEGTFMGVKGREYFIVKDGYSISVAELIKKLPGFKE